MGPLVSEVRGRRLCASFRCIFGRKTPERGVRLWGSGTRKAALVEIPGLRWSRGSDPRLLRLTMDGLLDRTCGERPRASRIVSVSRLGSCNL